MRSEAFVGKVGRVTVRIRGGEQPGEVAVQAGGLTHHLIAYAETPLESGAEVLVTTLRGPRQVDVLPWTG